MKKLILMIVLILSCIGLFGQNYYKYEMQASGGIRIGGPYKASTNVRLDSAILSAGSLKLYNTGDTLFIYTPVANREYFDDAWIGHNTPRATGNIVAGTGITAGMLSEQMYYNGASAINISAVPQIVDGTTGRIIKIIGSSDVNTLTLDDGNGLKLDDGASCILGNGDIIELTYNATKDLWLEITRSNGTWATMDDIGAATSLWINVKLNGVAGNGVTPDGLAIRTLIGDNKTLFFPRGTYIIDTILNFGARTNFKIVGEKGTVFLVNNTTNGTGTYTCIYIQGNTKNVEISDIEFKCTATYVATERPALIDVQNQSYSTENLSIVNCRFYAPNVDMNAVFMYGNTGIYNNISFAHNEIDSVGRIGIELYEDSYANEFDSTSFHNVKISDNYFSYTGTYGNYGMPISLGGNGIDISNNNIYNHKKNQAIEVGHSYRVNVSHNIVYSQYSSDGISNYRNHNIMITDNVFTFPNYTAATINVNDCSDFSITNNIIRAYQHGITLFDSDHGFITENNLRMTRTTGIWILDGCTYLLVSGNRIDIINNTGNTGGIRISSSDNTPMTGTADNIIENNTVTGAQVGMNYFVYNINRSLNEITNGSGAVKTKLFTIGTPGDTQVDYTFTSAANSTEQVITLTNALPIRCRVIGLEMVNVETVTSSGGAVDITLEAGTTSSGAEFIAALSCDDENEVVGIIDATKLAAIKMVWNASNDTYFSNVYVTGDPDQNWSTLTAGKWEIYLTYIDLRYK